MDAVSQELWFSDPAGHMLGFWFLTILGVVIGAVVYAGAAYARLRRPQVQALPSLPKGVALGLGVAVALFVAGLAWTNHFWGFYVVTLTEDEMVVESLFPRRRATLARDEVARVQAGMTGGRFDSACLVIEQTSGKVRRSEGLRPDELEPRLEAVQQWLADPDAWRAQIRQVEAAE